MKNGNELQRLKESVLRLGGLVEEQVAKSISALSSYDIDIARSVIEDDHKVNKMEVEIEEACLTYLAQRKPRGRDLRFVTTAIKIIDTLETVGDTAVNISERVLEISTEKKLEVHIDISKMAETAIMMLKKSLDAFVERDAGLAQEVRAEDDIVDSLCNQIVNELLSLMKNSPEKIPAATGIMSVSKYIERIADHSEGIAEMVLYMVDGKIVRHTEVDIYKG